MTSVANLPNFLLYFIASVVLFAAFLAAYTRFVPLHEWRLIREGNTAVALALAGAMLGFAMPLAVAIARSANLADMAEAILLAAGSVVLGLLNAACLT